MIIGLDHISFNCSTKKNFHKKFIDYYKLFEKKSINHKEKNLFLSKVFKKYLVSFYSSYKNLPPIEKTYYSFAKDKSKSIKVNKNKIILFVKLKKKEILFLNRAFKLKPKKKGRHINFFSLHDKKKYKIFIRKKKNIIKNYLDFLGYTSICFISTNLNEDFERCKKLKIELTKIFKFKINKKNLKIFFLRSPGGIIFEILQYL